MYTNQYHNQMQVHPTVEWGEGVTPSSPPSRPPPHWLLAVSNLIASAFPTAQTLEEVIATSGLDPQSVPVCDLACTDLTLFYNTLIFWGVDYDDLPDAFLRLWYATDFAKRPACIFAASHLDPTEHESRYTQIVSACRTNDLRMLRFRLTPNKVLQAGVLTINAGISRCIDNGPKAVLCFRYLMEMVRTLPSIQNTSQPIYHYWGIVGTMVFENHESFIRALEPVKHTYCCKHVFDFAIERGNKLVVDYMHSNGFSSWNQMTITNAIKTDKLDWVQYIHKLGAFISAASAMVDAVESRNLGIVEYVHENDPTPPTHSSYICATRRAADLKWLDGLEYLCSHGYPVDESVLHCAIHRPNNMPIVRYLIDHQCPWSSETFALTIRGNHHEVLDYLVLNRKLKK